MLVAELFFGRNINGRAPVTDAEWAEFAAWVITANFPDGFTVFDGNGQWRNPQTGRIGHEPTKILLVAAKPRPRRPAHRGDRRLQDPLPSAIGRDRHPRFVRGDQLEGQLGMGIRGW